MASFQDRWLERCLGFFQFAVRRPPNEGETWENPRQITTVEEQSLLIFAQVILYVNPNDTADNLNKFEQSYAI